MLDEKNGSRERFFALVEIPFLSFKEMYSISGMGRGEKDAVC
jgi:hypothetical protein